MFSAAEFAEAESFAQKSIATFNAAGVALKTSLAGPRTTLANIAFARGNLHAAQMQYAQSDLAAAGMSPAPKASRYASQARVFALLGQTPQAMQLVQAARDEICTLTSAASLDCATLTLAVADVALICDEHTLADQALKSLSPASLKGAAQINRAAQLKLRLALLTTPNLASAQAYQSWVQATPEAGLALFYTRRQLLLSAQQLWLKDRADSAKLLAQQALNMTQRLPIQAPRSCVECAKEGNMDASLLAIWQARIDGTATTPAMRAQLALAMGENHPWVMQLASL